ncbi:FMN-binding protein [Pseudomarimonas arenosa]|uniref:FMN-binding protein n=1 Tax=Pseudomarimonas arenosa TaxID=2774145 RepID=A0AAW3ZNA7_9GAMM|nr:FMN-binding protein [Pseudomarimonas arenosa]MBD8526117.1 FMN-binding protein [Pseudomarimonas arenosa]
MTELRALWQRFAALPNEHPAKTLLIVFCIASLCAALVSFTAVQLRPLQEQHRAAEREQRMSAMLSELPGMSELLQASGADGLESLMIDLDSGAAVDPASAIDFDWRQAIAEADQGQQCRPLERERDLVGIGCRPALGRVMLLRQGRQLELLVLPIYGRGYQSTLHALLVLQADLNTIAALQVHEQGETPGLGARIVEPAFQARFADRQLRNAAGEWRFAVRKQVENPAFEVDAIAGATRSSVTLGRMIEFWMGPDGYGPLLERLAKENEA